ncbi:hypothetical protein ACRDU6_27440 [Mycolicibacterium sp. ELW1]|uniref:hypothetical protein n=1 Tax=Mycobacteriaceae TaxID=1762 RepID=UPI0011EEBD93|nr:hypothetical protein [Mycobacterium sp. ELW1]QEN15929.1 hypothetical protein D3H54_23960 [Mycobacterium sp. ELW1]
MDNEHPVDWNTHPCCGGIGAHTPDCPAANAPLSDADRAERKRIIDERLQALNPKPDGTLRAIDYARVGRAVAAIAVGDIEGLHAVTVEARKAGRGGQFQSAGWSALAEAMGLHDDPDGEALAALRTNIARLTATAESGDNQ